MDKPKYTIHRRVPHRKGFALFITLSVLAVIIALTGILLSYFDEVRKDAETTKALIASGNVPGIESRLEQVKNIVDQINNVLSQIRSSRNEILSKFRNIDEKLDSFYQTLGFQRGQMIHKTSKSNKTMRQQ